MADGVQVAPELTSTQGECAGFFRGTRRHHRVLTRGRRQQRVRAGHGDDRSQVRPGPCCQPPRWRQGRERRNPRHPDVEKARKLNLPWGLHAGPSPVRPRRRQDCTRAKGPFVGGPRLAVCVTAAEHCRGVPSCSHQKGVGRWPRSQAPSTPQHPPCSCVWSRSESRVAPPAQRQALSFRL